MGLKQIYKNTETYPQENQEEKEESLEGLVDLRINVGSNAHTSAGEILRRVFSYGNISTVGFLDDDLKLNTYLYDHREESFLGVPEDWADRVIPAMSFHTKKRAGSHVLSPYVLLGYGTNPHDEDLKRLWAQSRAETLPWTEKTSKNIQAAGGLVTFLPFPEYSDFSGFESETEWLLQQDWFDAIEIWSNEPPVGGLESMVNRAGLIKTAGSGAYIFDRLFVNYNSDERVKAKHVKGVLDKLRENKGYLSQM